MAAEPPSRVGCWVATVSGRQVGERGGERRLLLWPVLWCLSHVRFRLFCPIVQDYRNVGNGTDENLSYRWISATGSKYPEDVGYGRTSWSTISKPSLDSNPVKMVMSLLQVNGRVPITLSDESRYEHRRTGLEDE